VKTRPIAPAQVEFGSGPGQAPRSALYGELYHPHGEALLQAQQVFLQGNGLPQRWQGRAAFTILETGFGLGNNFLATWQAWRADPARCERLFFVSIEGHPLSRSDLQRAHAGSAVPELAAALVQAWPPLTPNLHMLDFDGGRVQLLLALGDVAELLPTLRLQADAFFIDGFAPARNPAMWQARVLKALGRKAAQGATLATWSTARELRAGLTSAGFELQLPADSDGPREITCARFAPRFVPSFAPRLAPHGGLPSGAAGHTAVVVGAGLAGAAVAQALARLGVTVTVLERHSAPAREASGNPAGLFHGTVHPDDGPYARLFRAAALQAQRVYAAALLEQPGLGSVSGLLRLDTAKDGRAAASTLLLQQGLPADYAQAVDADAASRLAGVPLPGPAWHYPGGGWIAPAAWVSHALAQPGITFVGDAQVASLAREGTGWAVRDAAGTVLASAAIVVLANTTSAGRQLAALGHVPWPLTHTQGQVTYWSGIGNGASALRLPVAGDGYAIALPGGGLLCGATRTAGEPGGDETALPVRHADHLQNLERLARLTGLQAPDDTLLWQGRSAWRLSTDDRLPVAGALPLVQMPQGQRLDQARLLPREGGLFVLTALGARGLTLAPLLARLVAAQATGTPWPLEQDLADAVDPARWLVRAARAGSAVPSQPA
jgi:tRNA 5-methylaminomethyl-2-thiouridine biosynthesis bifunctional protein